MLLHHEFTVDLPLEETWTLFQDLPRVVTCFPGAELSEADGEAYEGRIKIKVGPISAQYGGRASFVERDDQKHRAVIEAAGRDSTGQGTAAATVTAVLSAVGTGTKVEVETDLTITGKVAQFGRGAINEVGDRMLSIFVDRLSTALSDGSLLQEGPVGTTGDAHVSAADDELDLGAALLLPMAKRWAPVAVSAVVASALTALVMRRRR
jgi:carbon monoxide dehydrogenase subunit G